MRPLRAAVLAGAGLAAYSLVEPYRFRLTSHSLGVAPGSPPLSVLHVSDTHMTRRSHSLHRWLMRLPEMLEKPPDLVLATGDLIDDNSGIPKALEGFNNLTARLGRFYVLGSHDYYMSRFQGFAKYFGLGSDTPRTTPARVQDLEEGLASKGWIALTNRTHELDTPIGRLRLAGVDDPYLKRHTTRHIERAPGDRLAIALVHSPDVVSEWALAGFDLVVAGHTHGGQVRIPGIGALVTNCSLPSALARGPSRIGETWLHVSPGLGHGHMSAIRLACRPEATLLRLMPEGQDR